jgi:hypothetical protein
MNYKYLINLICIAVLLVSNSISGQQARNNINIEMRYPIPIGNSIINENYSGMFDVGLDYNLFVLPFFNSQCGIMLHTSFLNRSNSNIDLIIFEPKFKYEYYTFLNNNFYYMHDVAIGYSFWKYANTATTTTNDIQNGINIQWQLKLLKETKKEFRYYFLLAYEFTKLNKDKSIADTKYNRNIHMLYTGIGFEIKFTK